MRQKLGADRAAEGEIHRSVALTGKFTSHELDEMEQKHLENKRD
jgi:hypothetical protein